MSIMTEPYQIVIDGGTIGILDYSDCRCCYKCAFQGTYTCIDIGCNFDTHYYKELSIKELVDMAESTKRVSVK